MAHVLVQEWVAPSAVGMAKALAVQLVQTSVALSVVEKEQMTARARVQEWAQQSATKMEWEKERGWAVEWVQMLVTELESASGVQLAGLLGAMSVGGMAVGSGHELALAMAVKWEKVRARQWGAAAAAGTVLHLAVAWARVTVLQMGAAMESSRVPPRVSPYM